MKLEVRFPSWRKGSMMEFAESTLSWDHYCRASSRRIIHRDLEVCTCFFDKIPDGIPAFSLENIASNPRQVHAILLGECLNLRWHRGSIGLLRRHLNGNKCPMTRRGSEYGKRGRQHRSRAHPFNLRCTKKITSVFSTDVVASGKFSASFARRLIAWRVWSYSLKTPPKPGVTARITTLVLDWINLEIIELYWATTAVGPKTEILTMVPLISCTWWWRQDISGTSLTLTTPLVGNGTTETTSIPQVFRATISWSWTHVWALRKK